jgi:hypothetical protein
MQNGLECVLFPVAAKVHTTFLVAQVVVVNAEASVEGVWRYGTIIVDREARCVEGDRSVAWGSHLSVSVGVRERLGRSVDR